MKKALKLAGLALAATCVIGVSACGPKALAIGKEYLAATSQEAALMKLDKGEADVAIIDSVMAGYYTTRGDYAGEMQIVEGLELATESCGIAAKKGNEALISKINQGLQLVYNAPVGYSNIAETFGVTESMVSEIADDPYASATDNSWNEVCALDKLVIGYTVFAPIAYDIGGNLSGFDIELAKAVVMALNAFYGENIEIDFQEITWCAKETLLDNGTIDLVWNGMTITTEREEGMTISVPYLYNKQVAVVLTQDATTYNSIESMSNAIMTAEAGSAGEAVIKG